MLTARHQALFETRLPPLPGIADEEQPSFKQGPLNQSASAVLISHCAAFHQSAMQDASLIFRMIFQQWCFRYFSQLILEAIMLQQPLSTLVKITTAAALMCIAGCNSGSGLSPVTGTVTLDGKPYPSAQVRFVPETGRPSIGYTDESGVYSLIYIRDEMGAAPGSYRVDITTVHISESDSDGGKEPPEKIPAKYNKSTDLKADVQPGENLINFDLTSR